MKPLALDLCCGLGGWTNGLLAAGWDVIGCDIEKWPGYPAPQITGDVRNVDAELLDEMRDITKGRRVSLVVASPPCQEFSKLSLPFFHKLKKSGFQPDKTIWEACVRIAQELKAPLVLENVRGAQTYMGPAKSHSGSFYLWGDVPACIPQVSKPKGINLDRKNFNGKALPKDYAGPRKYWGKSKERKECSARMAMIPPELSEWIGKCFYPVADSSITRGEA